MGVIGYLLTQTKVTSLLRVSQGPIWFLRVLFGSSGSPKVSHVSSGPFWFLRVPQGPIWFLRVPQGHLTFSPVTSPQDTASTGRVTFLDEVQSVRLEAQKLKTQGVNILIALGHSGYEVDKKIAREVEDIDLVVGGHTNTFLYTGQWTGQFVRTA